MTNKRLRSCAGAIPVLLVILQACSQGPAPVRPGTPAFFWAAAHNAWRSGDYLKTSDSLNQILANDNEYTARARVWQIVVASGLVQGYAELADAYEAGTIYNRSDRAAFRDRVRVARAAAAQFSLNAGETFRDFFKADKNTTIAFGFSFPAAKVAHPPQMAKLGKGILLQGAEAEAFQFAMLQRGVGLAAARLAPADAFAKGIPREQFLVASASALYEQSKLFGPKKLDQPQRLQMLCTLAQEALGSVPSSAKTRELQGNIQRALGKRRLT